MSGKVPRTTNPVGDAKVFGRQLRQRPLSVSRKNSFRDVEVEASSASRLMVPGGQDGAV